MKNLKITILLIGYCTASSSYASQQQKQLGSLFTVKINAVNLKADRKNSSAQQSAASPSLSPRSSSSSAGAASLKASFAAASSTSSSKLELKQKIDTKELAEESTEQNVSKLLTSKEVSELNRLLVTMNSKTQKVGDWLKREGLNEKLKIDVYLAACKTIYDLRSDTPLLFLRPLAVIREKLITILPVASGSSFSSSSSSSSAAAAASKASSSSAAAYAAMSYMFASVSSVSSSEIDEEELEEESAEQNVLKLLTPQEISQLNRLLVTINSKTKTIGDWLKSEELKINIYFAACQAIYDLRSNVPLHNLLFLAEIREKLITILPDDLKKISMKQNLLAYVEYLKKKSK